MCPRRSRTCSGIDPEVVNSSKEYQGPGVCRVSWPVRRVARRTRYPLQPATSSLAAFLDATPMQLGADKIATGHYARRCGSGPTTAAPTFQLLESCRGRDH